MVKKQLRVNKHCWNRVAENPNALEWRREWQGQNFTHSGSWWASGDLRILMSRAVL